MDGLARLAADVAIINQYGYKLVTREFFDSVAPQRDRDGIKGTPGKYAVFDPHDDEDGYALVGDDTGKLVSELAEHLRYCERENAK